MTFFGSVVDYYEVKTEKERFASRIKEVIENLLSRCKPIPSPESTKNSPAGKKVILVQVQNLPQLLLHQCLWLKFWMLFHSLFI